MHKLPKLSLADNYFFRLELHLPRRHPMAISSTNRTSQTSLYWNM